MSDVKPFDLAEILNDSESRKIATGIETALYLPDSPAVAEIIEKATQTKTLDEAWTPVEKLAFIDLMDEVERRKTVSGHLRYFPEEGPLSHHHYRRHVRFCNAGFDYTERLFMSGNRVGKSLTGAFEVACHATGVYPEWWQGRRFDHPTRIWVAGKTNQTTRDIIQLELLGDTGAWGSGMIAEDLIVGEPKSKPGVPGAIEFLEVRHVPTGKVSIIGFKSYDQGRRSFEGTAKHAIWLDEEAPLEVYNECLLRTMVSKESPRGGMLFTTFTPLEGLTPFIINFMESCDTPVYGEEASLAVKRDDSPNPRILIQAGTNHAPHLDPKEVEERLKNLPSHEQLARREGTPSPGQGLIYPVDEAEYVISPRPREPFWKKAYALDVGWNKTACLWGALDADNDILYIYREHYKGGAKADDHARDIMYGYIPGCPPMRGVVDPAARNRSQVDGENLLSQYRQLGLKIQPAENAVEAGISAVWSRMVTGRLKIFDTCTNLLYELRRYRRDANGKPMKKDDHLVDCLRYLVMSGLKVARADQPTGADRMGPGAKDYGV